MDIELQTSNFSTTIDIYECCICLENNYDNIIELNCCKTKLHKICFLDWIIYDNSENIKCAMCRTNIKKLSNIISKEHFLNYVNTLDLDNLPLFKVSNIYNIFKYQYNIDLYNDVKSNKTKLSNYKFYIIKTISLFILLFVLLGIVCTTLL